MMRTRVLVVALIVTIVAGLPAYAADDEMRDEFEIVFQLLQFIDRFGLQKVDVEQLVRGALQGMVEAIGDPYSQYLDPDGYQALLEQLDPTITGIGVMITARGGYVTVITPIKDTPAESAGLRPHDRIVAVDGKDVVGSPTEEVVRLLRGDEGTEVEVTVLRPDAGDMITVTITRAIINVPTVDSELITPQIGYIRISSFAERTEKEFKDQFEQLQSQGIEGLIIDLRYNGGGLMSQGIDIADLFVPQGPIAYLINKQGDRRVYRSETPPWDHPVVLLVNEGTASTAEIFAGSLQDWQSATVIGVSTFGKSSIQTIAQIPGHGAIRLTTAEYVTPIGRSLHETGLDPDIFVEFTPFTAPELTLDATLGFGSRGEQVVALQEYLRELGYGPLVADGVFGVLTQTAVQEFQSQHGHDACGSVSIQQGELIATLVSYQRDAQLAEAIKHVESAVSN